MSDHGTEEANRPAAATNSSTKSTVVEERVAAFTPPSSHRAVGAASDVTRWGTVFEPFGQTARLGGTDATGSGAGTDSPVTR
jgi:hypothetical protein